MTKTFLAPTDAKLMYFEERDRTQLSEQELRLAKSLRRLGRRKAAAPRTLDQLQRENAHMRSLLLLTQSLLQQRMPLRRLVCVLAREQKDGNEGQVAEKAEGEQAQAEGEAKEGGPEPGTRVEDDDSVAMEYGAAVFVNEPPDNNPNLRVVRAQLRETAAARLEGAPVRCHVPRHKDQQASALRKTVRSRGCRCHVPTTASSPAPPRRRRPSLKLKIS